MATEREAKIPIPAREPFQRRLVELGAKPLGDAVERNWVFDREAPGALAPRGMLLRLRTVDGRAGGLLTVKRMLAPSPAEGAFKVREELETRVDRPETMRAQLEALGFSVAWRYEKRRDEWDWRGCRVAVDDCPGLGCFVEAEGGEEAIRAVLADLGLEASAHVPANYLGLWAERCRRGGVPFGDMLFEEPVA